MSYKINSAYRIHNIYYEAKSYVLNGKVINGWAKVFSVEAEDKIELYKVVINKISLIDNEFDIILKSMDDTSLSKDRYTQSIKNLYGLITPDEFYHNWEQLRARISENDLNIMLICSELMKDEEDLIPEEDIHKIEAEISKLEEFLKKKNLDANLKKFVHDQIMIIKKCLSNYKIQGIKAFNTSFYEANTIIIRDMEILNNEEGKKVYSTLKTAWMIILNISEKLNKVTNLIVNTTKLLDIGSKFLDHL